MSLRLAPLQYSIRHSSPNDFKIGEKVFLKSNPEFPLEVIEIGETKVKVEVLATGVHE
jgi:hypothetical protein